MELEELNIGIALGGGGAKGAYSAGLCKALIENKKFKIKAISGTSVGGLNAFILASEKIKEGEDIWFNINFNNTYPLKKNKILSLLIGPLIILSNLFIEFILRNLPLRVYYNFRKKIIKWLYLYMILIVAITLVTVLLKLSSYWLFLNSIFIALYFFYTKLMKDDELLTIQRLILLNLAANFALFIGEASKSHHTHLHVDLILSGISLLIVLVFVIPGLVFPEATLMKNAPLKNTINTLVKNSKVKLPTYITTALKVTLYDPLDIRKSHTRYGLKKINNTTYVPIYSNLQNYTENQISELLTATAALPIGIVNKVNFEGRNLVDGGIIDNLPIFPLFEYENCDAVIAISLNTIENNELQSTYNLNDYHLRTYSMNLNYLENLNHEDKMRYIENIEVYFSKNTKEKILFCVEPKFDLGGWKNGTLNFDSEYAKNTYNKGYEHGLEIVEDLLSNEFYTKYLRLIPLGIKMNSFYQMNQINTTNKFRL